MPKTKVIVVGVQCEENLRLIYIKGETIEAVKECDYLGTILEPHGGIERYAQDRITHALRAFGALSKPVFRENDFSADKETGVPCCRVEMDKAKHSADANYTCGTCQRFFMSRQDIARHKCQTTSPRGGVCPRGNPITSVCHFAAEKSSVMDCLLSRFKVHACARAVPALEEAERVVQKCDRYATNRSGMWKVDNVVFAWLQVYSYL